MAYTQSAGLRDREYSKFEAIQTAGSNSGVRVTHPIQTYEFSVADLTASNTTGGSLDAFSAYPLNGMIKGVYLGDNNYTNATGSLLLNISGPEITVWSMISGTIAGAGVAVSGAYVPRATTVYTWGAPISGADQSVVLAEIALPNTTMHLVGSTLGTAKSGLSFIIAYQ